MSQRYRAILAAAAAALMAFVATTASAITDEEVFRTFRFNFVNPGGRAGAMGGSFVGIADDATAAAANPAGLTNLISPELFLELRLDDSDPVNLTATVEDPRGLPTDVLTESFGDPDNVLFPSFISYVHPFKHWVVGVSRQELLNSNIDTENLFTTKPLFPPTTLVQAVGHIETLLENYNVSFGFHGGEWFAGGVSLTYSRLDVESRTENKFISPGGGLDDDYATAVDDTDEDFTFSAGVLFKPIDMFSVGLVYRDGAEFDLEEEIEDTRPPGNFPSAQRLADFLGDRDFIFDDPLFFNNHFAVPDQYGVGFGIKPTQAFTIAIDVIQVEYSDLEEDLVGNVNALTFPGDAAVPAGCTFGPPMGDGSVPCEYSTPIARYELDDSVVYHLGLEYVWSIKEKTPFALRAGMYNDPNIRLDAQFPDDGVFIADDETFPAGHEEMHYTAGFGFVLQDKFQADFSADWSKLGDTYVASIIFHF